MDKENEYESEQESPIDRGGGGYRDGLAVREWLQEGKRDHADYSDDGERSKVKKEGSGSRPKVKGVRLWILRSVSQSKACPLSLKDSDRSKHEE